MDTIEILEAIGSDASLRHASATELGRTLASANASEALSAAVAAGDSTHLTREFGDTIMHLPQIVQTYS